jgi:hypothetical protein
VQRVRRRGGSSVPPAPPGQMVPQSPASSPVVHCTRRRGMRIHPALGRFGEGSVPAPRGTIDP